MMGKILSNGKVSIGVYQFHDRKRPSLCIQEGNKICVYGHFNSEDGANEFMEALARMFGVDGDGWKEADGNG